jgi:acyl dehydratase
MARIGLSSLVRLVARGARAARGPLPVRELTSIPRGRLHCERGGLRIEPAAIRAYARATGGDHLFAFFGEGAVAPPFLASTWEPSLVLELLSTLEPPLPLAPLIHLSSRTTWARVLRPGDEARCSTVLERVEANRQGLCFTVLVRNSVGAGRLCSESTARYLLRTPLEQAPPLDRGRPAPEHGWVELVRWRLEPGDGRRYARVSGDWNPIHLWPATSRLFGFRRPILQGHAIAARTAHTLVDLRFHGDPAALRRMSIRFRTPLALPATPLLSVCETDAGERWFRVSAPDGAVHAEGRFGGPG